ncbi:MAG: class I SAM-dependent methyltransferase [Pseudanabaenaceae cyanobacterium SKYGB_i_bin29]|nr:class I SAM-dependent methyltransferase [Pseudanabaenaceae cyanobacterium SKYG29]MDW8421181.1 class I SAM-dependent methyltransferase [Pseudanabaenaceae cyanobacterium SKYGB_i_bin29]
MRPITPVGILAQKLQLLLRQARELQIDSEFLKELEAATALAQGMEPYTEYCTSPDSEPLQQLVARTRSEDWQSRYHQGETVKPLIPEMLSGQVEGQFLQMLIYALKAKRVLEIGMFTGYSALSMAEALPEDGVVITCEIDPFAAQFAQESFRLSPHGKKIDVRVAPAMETLQKLAAEGQSFDFIFIDADKGGYVDYFRFILDRHLLAPGGIIAVDNTFYEGQAYLPEAQRGENGKAIAAFNEVVRHDDRVVQVLVPLRDGVTLIRRV